jgi:hypothetical protein
MFQRTPLAFQPGLFANRSRKASPLRWVDGNFVRFRDGLPQSIGGWQELTPDGDQLTGTPRSMISYRQNNQLSSYGAIGTETGIWQYNGDNLTNLTAVGFTAGDSMSSWVFDMFGQDIMACFSGDKKIYYYPFTGATKFELLAGAPTAWAICVSDERHLFAFGADGLPGYVRWSHRENYTVWAPLSTNRAGGYEVQVRSPFQIGRSVRGSVLGWTKHEVYRFSPTFNSKVYDHERIATEGGVVGPHAVAVVTDNQSHAAYWMGPANFYYYDGLVRTLNCELHDYIYRDINLEMGAKFYAFHNSQFNEIWFGYCSALSSEVDRIVTFNYGDGTWSKANMARSAWCDSGAFKYPLAFNSSGQMFEHEYGDEADGSKLESFVLSHPITIGNASQFADVDQFWPDFQDGSQMAEVSFLLRNWPGQAPEPVGPFEVTAGTEFQPLSFSAREFQLKIAGKDGFWELGLPVVSMQVGSLR